MTPEDRSQLERTQGEMDHFFGHISDLVMQVQEILKQSLAHQLKVLEVIPEAERGAAVLELNKQGTGLIHHAISSMESVAKAAIAKIPA